MAANRGWGMARRVIRRLAAAAVVAVFLMSGSSGMAATETSVDCGAGADLQAAIDAAPKGTILDITGTCVGSFTVSKNLVLRGVSNAVLDAQGRDVTLTVTKGHVRLARLTVTGAGVPDRTGDGGIDNAGTLTLFRVTVTGNVGVSASAGVFNRGTMIVQRSLITQNDGSSNDAAAVSNIGSVTIEKTTISSNPAVGIASRGTLTVTDSTVSGNHGVVVAGGLDVSGTTTIIRSTIANNSSQNGDDGAGVSNGGTLTITESTIVGNRADFEGAGLFNSGTATIAATIIAGNTVSGSPWDCTGSVVSNGYNLIGTTWNLASFGAQEETCSIDPRSTDEVGGTTAIDPVLNPLGSYGGPTQTVLPKPTSPAINKIPIGATSSDGSTALCPASGTTDQRGIARPQGSACDIGSVERKPTG
jgi:hypothetical protein